MMLRPRRRNRLEIGDVPGPAAVGHFGILVGSAGHGISPLYCTKRSWRHVYCGAEPDGCDLIHAERGRQSLGRRVPIVGISASPSENLKRLKTYYASAAGFDHLLLAAKAICRCPSRSERDPGLETSGNPANAGQNRPRIPMEGGRREAPRQTRARTTQIAAGKMTPCAVVCALK
jgi:hypothetical protein